MKYITIFIFLMFSEATFAKGRCVDDSLCSVSIIHLTANPDLYHGKDVIVRGFFHHDEGRYFLYLDADKAKYGFIEYGLVLDMSSYEGEIERIENNSYLLIQGAFDKDDWGAMGVPPLGTILVSRVQ